jgi:uncharacterized membrane protein YagU involved in acid resistance
VNWENWLISGFVATVLQTTLSTLAQGLGMTRMNIPYIFGTMLTADRDRAKLYGFGVHVAAGWVFSLIYVLIFQLIGNAGWWRGLIIGVLHALFVLTVIASILPGVHPRMASEQHGPEAQNMLEPPGFMAVNYGIRTPAAVILSHALFGIVLGALYRLR